MRWEWSPSWRRAQELIFQAWDQPVPPSPRKSKDLLAAAYSAGVPRWVISGPGRRSQGGTGGWQRKAYAGRIPPRSLSARKFTRSGSSTRALHRPLV
jgi:hypothetical protein